MVEKVAETVSQEEDVKAGRVMDLVMLTKKVDH